MSEIEKLKKKLAKIKDSDPVSIVRRATIIMKIFELQMNLE